MRSRVRNLIFCLFSFGEQFVMTLRNILVAQTSVFADCDVSNSDGRRLKSLRKRCLVLHSEQSEESLPVHDKGLRGILLRIKSALRMTLIRFFSQTAKPVPDETPHGYFQECAAECSQ